MRAPVTIETASRPEAELLAALLPEKAAPKRESARGFVRLRLGTRTATETHEVIQAVAAGVEQHGIQWARVRHGDDEHVFRANGRRRLSPR